MHDVLFSTKRTFHKQTWFGRAILAPYKLTPSRFDVLFILHEYGLPMIWQSKIWKIVGVSASTTSIMVRALVKLGLLERKESEDDKRQLEVSLTAKGKEVIARAVAAIRGKKLVEYFVKRIVSSVWWDKEQSTVDVDALAGTLRWMRDRLADKAVLAYSYEHPDG